MRKYGAQMKQKFPFKFTDGNLTDRNEIHGNMTGGNVSILWRSHRA